MIEFFAYYLFSKYRWFFLQLRELNTTTLYFCLWDLFDTQRMEESSRIFIAWWAALVLRTHLLNYHYNLYYNSLLCYLDIQYA